MEFCLWMIMLCLVGIQNVLCITIGIYIGTKLYKDTKLPDIELPNPVKAVKEYKANKEAEYQKNAYDTIMQNIEAYDGTAIGQKDVPRR